MLLPFQAVLDRGSGIQYVRLYDFNTEKYIDITNSLKENGLIIKQYNGFSIIKYPGTLPVVDIKYEGYII